MCRLRDHFHRFWFRYILPNRATLEQRHTAPVRRAVEEIFPTHISWTFEDVCRQAVRTPAFPVRCLCVGRWWDDEMEVDVAGVNEQDETLLLGEDKWIADAVGRDFLADLEAT